MLYISTQRFYAVIGWHQNYFYAIKRCLSPNLRHGQKPKIGKGRHKYHAPITTETLRDLMEGCTDALMDAMRSAELAGISSQGELARLRKITVVHASRIGSSVGINEETTAVAENSMTVPPWCSCEDYAHV